jgi:hypothetical protein
LGGRGVSGGLRLGLLRLVLGDVQIPHVDLGVRVDVDVLGLALGLLLGVLGLVLVDLDTDIDIGELEIPEDDTEEAEA